MLEPADTSAHAADLALVARQGLEIPAVPQGNPLLGPVVLDDLVYYRWEFEETSSELTIWVRQAGSRPFYTCSGCGIGSERIHSVRERRVRDLPWGDRIDKRSLVAWARRRRTRPLRQMGVDELFWGKSKCLTVVSDWAAGEPTLGGGPSARRRRSTASSPPDRVFR